MEMYGYAPHAVMEQQQQQQQSRSWEPSISPDSYQDNHNGPGAQAGGGAGPSSHAQAEELVEVADKSCSLCRNRKVKCDRVYPVCLRCIKRGDTCIFERGFALSLTPLSYVQPPKRPRPAPLPPSQLHSTSANNISANNIKNSNAPHSPAYPSAHTRFANPSTSSSNQHLISRSKPSADSSDYYRPPDPHSWRQTNGGQSQNGSMNFQSLWDSFLSVTDIGHRSLDWHLAQPAMASSLTDHLLEASTHSCCSHLRAFALFRSRISYFRQNLDNLNEASKVAVTILTSLGARASPHSALLGVAGPDIESGNASHDLNLSAGIRRERSWRAITESAVGQSLKLNIMNRATMQNIETLVALSNALLFSEVRPDRSRFFHRTAVGLYQDLQCSNDLSPEELAAFNKTIGPTIYETDARIAAYAGVPFLLRDSDLREGAFSGVGIRIPDLEQENLSYTLDILFSPQNGLITQATVDEALSLAQYYVCSAQRAFATLASAKRSSTSLAGIHRWWSLVDQVHGALQKLYRLLTNLPERDNEHGHGHKADYDILMSVRFDVRMVDLLNLAHIFLLEQRPRLERTTDAPMLANLIDMSEMRVRKGLKLTAFYAKTFTDSLDRHVLYHLFTQIEVLQWVPMAVQRVGEYGGPLTEEYEVSIKELQWFAEALEIACFYSPVAADRLEELQFAMERSPSLANAYPFANANVGPPPAPLPITNSSASVSPPFEQARVYTTPQEPVSPNAPAYGLAMEEAGNFNNHLATDLEAYLSSIPTPPAGPTPPDQLIPLSGLPVGSSSQLTPMVASQPLDLSPLPIFDERGLWRTTPQW